MTVTVIRPLGTDRYGDPVAGTPPEHTLEGAVVAPTRSTDVTDRGRNGAVVGLTLYAPPDADLERTDLVRYRGEVYELDGDVGVWESPYSSAVDGIEVALRRGEG